jgi:hypothetical protein
VCWSARTAATACIVKGSSGRPKGEAGTITPIAHMGGGGVNFRPVFHCNSETVLKFSMRFDEYS